MGIDNKGYVKSDEDLEMKDKGQIAFGYEEALDLTGHGIYNSGLLLTCCMIITATGIDISGLSIIANAATCDLGMTIKEIGVLSSIPLAGMILMSYPWGYLSDTRGRKLVLMYAMCGSFVSATLSSFAPNWQVLVALRFVCSAMSSAGESVTYALLGECCNSRSRARYMLLVTSAEMLSSTVCYTWNYFIMKLDFSIPFLGIVFRPWRLLTLVMALPLGLSALLLYFFTESPKFLAEMGRNEEAVEALKRIYAGNGGKLENFAVKKIYLEEGSKDAVIELSLYSPWAQINPLFKPPLLWKTLLLYYLNSVIYITNNSFAIILPTILNVFFKSYATSSAGMGFCDLFKKTISDNVTVFDAFIPEGSVCQETIEDNTIWAGCAFGILLSVLNTLTSLCAKRRKVISITVLLMAAAAAFTIDNTGEPLSGLILFYIFQTTSLGVGIVCSYFVDLYPTSYRSTVACLGLMVARLSSFAGTNLVSSNMSEHCLVTLYGATGLLISGAVTAALLPSDTLPKLQ